MKQEKNFNVAISKVNELLFSGLAHSMTLPGTEGTFTVLADHESLITLLKEGKIIVRTDSGEQAFPITKGLFEMSHGQVTVLV